jgi:hypothetical protein
MSKLLLMPGSFAADYCLPWEAESDPTPFLYLIQDENLASLSILVGTVIVARPLRGSELPPDNSFCIVHVREGRYLKRVRFVCGRLQLSDDTGDEEFDSGEVHLAAVALYACACDRLGLSCSPVPLSVETGLEIFRQKAGMLRWQTDEHGYVLISDEMRAWISFAGGNPEAWAGWGWIDFLHLEDKNAYLFRWSEAIETGKPYLNQGRIVIGGAWLYMVVSANPIRDSSGRIVKWEGFLHVEEVEIRKSA